MKHTLADFDFALPPELVAQHPAAERSGSRLLDGTGALPADRQFRDLPGLLNPGDLLVFNDTRVIKARLHGEKRSGGAVQALVERVLPGHEVWAHLRASKSPRPGSLVRFADAFDAQVLGRAGPDGGLFHLRFPGDPFALLARHGHVPLPPYIQHADGANDEARYQTIFAARPGAVAAPTAALHFDAGVLAYNSNPQAMQVNVTGISNSLSKEISVTAAPTGVNRWTPQIFTFVADSVSSTLTFSDESAFTDSIDLLLDNVRVTAAATTVPQPSILAGSPSLTGSPGNFMVGMTVTEAGSYVLERSENLAAWEVVTTVQLTAPGMLEFQDLQDPLDAGAPQGKRFYRIGFQPTAPVN